ncbi:hypothetical protein COY95_03450 [Candidatus Woesearchaeota archaeon CG_4_10_14_0_8_um_filter_47_5]|nr:MAG: hypothetical protein COY95_03450 [Candidatus Woesearchaeota archaeon CG_4_10_14_0_8_um_filter_47_5]
MKETLISEAFSSVFPEEEFVYVPVLRYSGRFNGYNGSVALSGRTLTVSLSRKWRDVDRLIVQGLVEELLWKLLHKRDVKYSQKHEKRKKPKTMAMDMYHTFLKQVHVAVSKTKNDPILEASFQRVNEHFFFGLVEQPNLVWLGNTVSKMGSYDYGTDTLGISRSLEDDEKLLDYVMHHEMLHKKLKFSSGGSGTQYHTRKFREMEQAYPQAEALEERLKYVAGRAQRTQKQKMKQGDRSSVRRSWFGWW